MSRFKQLRILNCSGNQIKCIQQLPKHLYELYCEGNYLISLPNDLPQYLAILNCSKNRFTILPTLPCSLIYFNCSSNKLTLIPSLSSLTLLRTLICFNNRLQQLPDLHSNIENIHCLRNDLIQLPSPLPDKLIELYCQFNQLTFLPPLNINLEILHCSHNQITQLPRLNTKLERLFCDFNQIQYLPHLPQSLQKIHCIYNKIAYLPDTIVEKADNFIFFNLVHGNEDLQLLNCRSQTKLNDRLKQNIKAINRFRYLYYSVRFQKQFRKWLWEYIRQPKIEKEFHPDYYWNCNIIGLDTNVIYSTPTLFS